MVCAITYMREWPASCSATLSIVSERARCRGAMRVEGELPYRVNYVARATARSAFVKAHADQMAHFAAGRQGSS
jgi:glutathione S-transferase